MLADMIADGLDLGIQDPQRHTHKNIGTQIKKHVRMIVSEGSSTVVYILCTIQWKCVYRYNSNWYPFSLAIGIMSSICIQLLY